MPNIYDIISRANSLRNETALNSITPDRAGSIMYDTLLYINTMQLQQSNPLLISKIYATVSAMEADSAPVSDITGQALKEGQVVCIVTSSTSSADYGVIYRYNGTSDGVSSWTACGKLGSLPYLEGYQFIGVATPSTDPGVPTQKVAYLAVTAGTYENFGNLTVSDGEAALLKWNGSAWVKETTGLATAAKLTQLDQKGIDFTSQQDEYYFTNTGNLYLYSGWSILYFPVIEGENYTYSGLSSVGNSPYSAYLKGAEVLSTFKQAIGANTITIPAGCDTLAISMKTTDISSFSLIGPRLAKNERLSEQVELLSETRGDILVGTGVPCQPYAVRNLRPSVSAAKVIIGNNDYAYILKVTSGVTYVINLTIPSGGSNYLRAAFTQYYPGQNLPISDYFEKHAGTWEFVKIAPYDGYLLVTCNVDFTNLEIKIDNTGKVGRVAYESEKNAEFAINPVPQVLDDSTCIDGEIKPDNRRKRFLRPLYNSFTIKTKSGYKVYVVNYYDRDGNFVRMDYVNSPVFSNSGEFGALAVFSATDAGQSISSADFFDDIFSSYDDGSITFADGVELVSASLKSAAIVRNSNKPKSWGGYLWSDGYVWRWDKDGTLFTVSDNFQTIKISNGAVLNQKNEAVASTCYSITKAMTCLLADLLIADWSLSVTYDAVDGTGDNFASGDTATLEDLIYDALLPSDNSAAHAIGRMVGNTIIPTATEAQKLAKCIELMNAKALEIGMTDTIYTSAAGGSTSTPADQCKLLRYIYNNAPRVLVVWAALTHNVVFTGSNPRTIEVTSTTTSEVRANIIPEFAGGKTGSGNATQGTYICLWTSMANNEIYGTVVMEGISGIERFRDVRRLIDAVYNNE